MNKIKDAFYTILLFTTMISLIAGVMILNVMQYVN